MMDIILFAGQSNMAGRGISDDRWPEKKQEPEEGCGYEYRAVTAPDRLSEMTTDFGVNENRVGMVYDGCRKSGSLVPAFVNAYYRETGRQVIAVSASEGGTAVNQWVPGEPRMTDACERLKAAVSFAEASGIKGHVYVVWCQGETDGDIGTGRDEYINRLSAVFREFVRNGAEEIFQIIIGEYNGEESISYGEIQEAQRSIVHTELPVTIVSDSFCTMKARGLMKDAFHYYQKAYNEVGEEAGINTAAFVCRQP